MINLNSVTDIIDGNADVLCHFGPPDKSWDVAAGLAMLKIMGFKCKTLNGKDIDINYYNNTRGASDFIVYPPSLENEINSFIAKEKQLRKLTQQRPEIGEQGHNR